MFRIMIIGIYVAFFLIASLIVQPIMLLIGLFSRNARDRASLAIVNHGFKLAIFMAGVKVSVSGEENVPKDEPVLYILNHHSIFDIVLTYVRVPRPTGYVAKKEMGKYLTLTWWMKLLYCVLLDRSDVRKGMKAINTCVDYINRGISIAIFPEGTRNKTSEPLLEFHKGSFKIAEKTGCKIVPVVLTNTSSIFEDHLPFIKAVNVTIDYLPPIDVGAMSREEKRSLADMVHSIMEEAYLKRIEG
ncbi:MAG: 1-acyl-sn-glycerol-3-phosphate acyltransferase [Lachnospiraceae bacterium]|nr:1-acyl-sn-glycerol-3-phosphate acyltransferase [Lachnospiraceae bacterium]